MGQGGAWARLLLIGVAACTPACCQRSGAGRARRGGAGHAGAVCTQALASQPRPWPLTSVPLATPWILSSKLSMGTASRTAEGRMHGSTQRPRRQQCREPSRHTLPPPRPLCSAPAMQLRLARAQRASMRETCVQGGQPLLWCREQRGRHAAEELLRLAGTPPASLPTHLKSLQPAVLGGSRGIGALLSKGKVALREQAHADGERLLERAGRARGRGGRASGLRCGVCQRQRHHHSAKQGVYVRGAHGWLERGPAAARWAGWEDGRAGRQRGARAGRCGCLPPQTNPAAFALPRR